MEGKKVNMHMNTYVNKILSYHKEIFPIRWTNKNEKRAMDIIRYISEIVASKNIELAWLGTL